MNERRTIGTDFVHAVADQDPAAIRSLVADPVDFQALTPGAGWRAATPAELVDIVLGHWFAPPREVREIRSIQHGQVGARERIAYRLGVRRDGTDYTVEQQAYFDSDGDRIHWMRLLCSGFQQDPAGTG